MFILVISISLSFLLSRYILDKIYESSSTLIIHGSNLDEKYKDLRDPRIYRAIATSNQMMSGIIEKLHLNCEIEDIRKKLIVSYEEETGLIYIKAEDEDQESAFQIVRSLVNGLQKRVEELFGENYLKIVDSPYIPEHPSRPSMSFNIVVATMLAVLFSVLFILWDTKRR